MKENHHKVQIQIKEITQDGKKVKLIVMRSVNFLLEQQSLHIRKLYEDELIDTFSNDWLGPLSKIAN